MKHIMLFEQWSDEPTPQSILKRMDAEVRPSNKNQLNALIKSTAESLFNDSKGYSRDQIIDYIAWVAANVVLK